ALLGAVGTRTIAVEHRTLRSYLGGWVEYAGLREERIAAGEDPRGPPPERSAPAPYAAAPPPKPQPAAQREEKADGEDRKASGNGRRSGPSKNALREQQRLERAVEEAEAALAALEEELSDPAAWANQYESKIGRAHV